MSYPLYFLLLVSLSSCFSHEPTHEEKLRELQNRPVTKESFWKDSNRKTLLQKIYTKTPQEVVDYAKTLNEIDRFVERPKVTTLDEKWKLDIEKALESLPKSLLPVINKWVAGITFVKDLGGTATAIGVKNSEGVEKSIVIVFDIDSMDKKANEWCSWKESTPFRPVRGYSLECTIENESENNRSNNFQYTFLHELGHFFLAEHKLDFPWDKRPTSQEDIDAYQFGKLSWKYVPPAKGATRGRVISKFDYIFPERQMVTYYSLKPKLTMQDASATYHNLKKTNFSTLYGAYDPNDDVADSFVNYIHTEMMGKPFKIEIFKNNRVVMSYESCWKEERCLEKRQIFERYLR